MLNNTKLSGVEFRVLGQNKSIVILWNERKLVISFFSYSLLIVQLNSATEINLISIGSKFYFSNLLNIKSRHFFRKTVFCTARAAWVFFFGWRYFRSIKKLSHLLSVVNTIILASSKILIVITQCWNYKGVPSQNKTQ